MPWFWEKNALTRFIYGFDLSFKMLFQAYLGKKSPKFFPAVPFFRMLLIRYLPKCPYFQKPPLPWKVPGYAPVNSTWKLDFSTPVSQTSGNVYHFVSIWWLVSFGVCVYIQYFFDVVRKKFQTIRRSNGNQNKIKISRKEYVM